MESEDTIEECLSKEEINFLKLCSKIENDVEIIYVVVKDKIKIKNESEEEFKIIEVNLLESIKAVFLDISLQHSFLNRFKLSKEEKYQKKRNNSGRIKIKIQHYHKIFLRHCWCN